MRALEVQMTLRNVSLERSGHIARLTLRRPGAQNAMNGAVLRDLAEACEAISVDEEAWVVVLSAEGDTFCAGWDKTALEGASPAEMARAQAGEGDLFACLAELARPVVCAVNGDALSAGLELALACDVRLAAEGARIGLPEVSMGLLPMAGGTQRLARLVGRGKALEMILSGKVVDAAEALTIGLVSVVSPRDRLAAESEAVAERIAERGPLAVRYVKEAVNRGLEMPLEQALRYETDLTVILQTTEDRAEGVRAFLEKRKPEFRGR
jgi:enoyl-CoA hydratase